MPEHPGKIEISIKDSEELIQKLIDAGIPEKFMANSISSGMILSLAIDFIKKLGALMEFMKTLSIADGAFLHGLFKIRPKELGDNQFD